jgi:hypothetical protein
MGAGSVMAVVGALCGAMETTSQAAAAKALSAFPRAAGGGVTSVEARRVAEVGLCLQVEKGYDCVKAADGGAQKSACREARACARERYSQR